MQTGLDCASGADSVDRATRALTYGGEHAAQRQPEAADNNEPGARMSLVFWICLLVFIGIVASLFRRGADLLSPARVFGLVWSLSLGLTELKLSALQYDWTADSWIFLLTGLAAFFLGAFITYVVNLDKPMVPLRVMRTTLRHEQVREGRLFWLICASGVIYTVTFAAHYMIKGWLPISVVGTGLSRVDFNVYGLTLFLYSAAFIVILTVLYHILFRGKRRRKWILTLLSLLCVGSYLLLLQRFQIIMAIVISFALLYYTTNAIRIRTTLPVIFSLTGVFYSVASLRLAHLVASYTYLMSRMKFSRTYAFMTEPYMYVVMNLENFARSVHAGAHLTYGYFTFDFIVAVTGLKYWIPDYLPVDRTPNLISGYNTYTAFWWFFSDFGVIGLMVIPFALGLGIGALYYRMRQRPTLKNVTAYGITVFVMFISYFNFPVSLLWFQYDMLAVYLILRWTVIPRTDSLLLPAAVQ